ncbi:helix-turn-helix domain-containing protein [Chryseobacterium sp.]|uniref:helix-turn-helix domain-containing protein n=1 Tax=Chryseobacterium sp. TaxID=1871047 RepID=UPI002FC74462
MNTTIQDILTEFNISMAAIRSTTRKGLLPDLRKIISYELRSQGYTYMQIGAMLNKDHSTVVFYVNEYMNLLRFDKKFREKVEIVEKMKNNMKILLTLDNSKLVVLNNAMQFLDSMIIQDHPKKNRMILSLVVELRTELLQKAIKTRQKDKSFVLKIAYHKAEALLKYLQEYEIHFPDSFGSYEKNAILQMINELHRQLL